MTPGEVARQILRVEDELGSIRQSLASQQTDLDGGFLKATWPEGFSSNIITLLGYVERDLGQMKLAVAEGKRDTIAARARVTP